MSKTAVLAATLIAIVFGVSDAAAHTRSESYSHWHLLPNGVTGIVTIPLREVMSRYESGNAEIPAAELFQRHLERTTNVSSTTDMCTRSGSNILQVASGFVRVELQFECAGAAPEQIRYRAMFDVAPAHVHYAKTYRNGVIVSEALLTDSADSWNIVQIESGRASSFVSFARVGMQHITGGIDHIAFLLGLLLIAGSTGRSVIAVTGFTLGHSISLAAAVLGYVSANNQLVEAFIGFTIMLVAAEFFVLRRQKPTSIALVMALFAWITGLIAFASDLISAGALAAYAGCGIFAYSYLFITAQTSAARIDGDNRLATILLLVTTACFGLIHGFGFAGFLMETGLLGRNLLAPLLGFNLGVEFGQLLFVAIAISLAALFRRQTPAFLPPVIAACLCGVGVFWFVGRTLA